MYKRVLCALCALLMAALCACAPKQEVSDPAGSTPAPAQEIIQTEAEKAQPVELNTAEADLGVQSGSYALRNRRGEYLFQVEGVLGFSDTPYLWYFDNQGDGSFLIKDAETRSVMLDIYNAWYDIGNRVTAYDYTGDPAQLWKLTAQDDTSFCIDPFLEPSLRFGQTSGWFMLGSADYADDVNVWTLWEEGDVPPQETIAAVQHTPAPDDIFARWDTSSTSKSNKKYAQYLYYTSFVNGEIDIYMIDFCTDDAPIYTYYALCDFWMSLDGLRSQPDFAELPNTEMNIMAGGAYAGLQTHESGPAAIMSFWHIEYIDTDGQRQLIEARRLYPAGGKTNKFGNEGTGTNYFTNIDWEPSHWYRMVIRCWDDADTGTTLVGQWLCDLESGEWTLISYFDTGYPDSAMKAVGRFLEDWAPDTNDQVRSWKLKNIYGREKKTALWHSLDNVTIQAVDFGAQTGGYEYGVKDNCFWGKTCGIGRDMKEGVTEEELRHVFRISQPAEPELPETAEPELTLTAANGTVNAEWTFGGSTPQCTAYIEITDGSGAAAASAAVPRPEVNTAEIGGIAAGTYTVRLTVTDIWGRESSVSQSIDMP